MKKLRWIPVIAYAAFIFYVSVRALLTPHLLPPHVDKVIHFGIYSGFGFGLVWAFRATRLKDHPNVLLIATMVGLFYGATTEFTQSFVPGRSAEVGDLIADGLGSLLGAWLAIMAARAIHVSCDRRSQLIRTKERFAQQNVRKWMFL